MTDTTPPDWVLIEAAKRGKWYKKQQEPDFGKNQYRISPTFRALCDMIEKYEQEPVDRKVLCAREAMFEVQNGAVRNAKGFQVYTGKDVAIRAIELWEEGFGK